MAADYFLKLEGIKGESTDDKHKDEIDVLSFSWGASQITSWQKAGPARDHLGAWPFVTAVCVVPDLRREHHSHAAH